MSALKFSTKLKPIFLTKTNTYTNYKSVCQKRNYGVLSPRLLNSSSLNSKLNVRNSIFVFNQSQRTLFGWGGKSTTAAEPIATQSFNNAATTSPEPIVAEPPAPDMPSPIDGYIPEPPPIPLEELALNALGEPTLKSLGLASSYWPSSYVQSALEMLHVNCGLEWMGSMIVFTLALRVALLPLSILIQKSAAKQRIVMPLLSELNQKLTEAKNIGDQAEAMRVMSQMQHLFKVHDYKIRYAFLPMAQAPFIVSTFFAIRQMGKLPVESLSTAGMFWFTDLTAADPYFILPLLSSATLFIIIERGLETGASTKDMSHAMKWAMRGMSCAALPFFIFQPAAVMVYVCTTNAFSLVLNLALANEKLRKRLGLPIIDSKLSAAIAKRSQARQKPFLEGFKEAYRNGKLTSEMTKREQIARTSFEQAGLGLPTKTFKKNPKEKQKRLE